ncbi:MAG TPA: hypothetical protein VD838_08945, partial [Anaeromyxobacteraceae bacterium]|nr:hypothetical protein [Anaeromyxobacteraceae bacterium]
MIALHVPEAMLVAIFVLLIIASHAALVTRDDRRRGRADRTYDLRYPREWRIPAAVAGTALVLAALLVTGRGKPWEGAARVVLALLGAGA